VGGIVDIGVICGDIGWFVLVLVVDPREYCIVGGGAGWVESFGGGGVKC